MDYRDRTTLPPSTAAADPAVTTNTTCPFCKSTRVVTTSKTISAATYWRCLSCGDIWNPGRAASRWPPRRNW
jgi:transposase-like protein